MFLQCFCTAKKNFKTTIYHQWTCDITFNSLSLTSKLSLSRLVQIQFNFSSSNMQLCPIRNLITNFICGLIHLLFDLVEFRRMQSLKLYFQLWWNLLTFIYDLNFIDSHSVYAVSLMKIFFYFHHNASYNFKDIAVLTRFLLIMGNTWKFLKLSRKELKETNLAS